MAKFTFLILLCSLAMAEVNLSGVRTKLAAATTQMATAESQLGTLTKALKITKAEMVKECGVDLDSTRASNSKCSPDRYRALSQQFVEFSNIQKELDLKLEAAKAEYKKVLVDAKAQLTNKDFVALMETSQDLNDAQIKKLVLNSKSDILRSDIEQAKAEIMRTDNYKLMAKGMTNMLNSKLFCQARDRCDDKAGNIYEGDVAAKILSGAARSLAKEKVPGATGNAPR